MTRPRPPSGERHSHNSPEATIRRESQSRLVRGQPRMGDAFVIRLMLASGEMHIFDAPEGASDDAPGATRFSQPLRFRNVCSYIHLPR
jgi:hypothetical protein